MDNLKGIELHRYLPKGKHSVDAVLRNRSEAELLALFHEVAEALGVPVAIDAHALIEGGLREIWEWAGGNDRQITIILTVVAILIALVPAIYESEADRLDERLTNLSIEEKELNIELLRKQLREIEPSTEESVKHSAVEELKSHPRVVVRRSNFYRHLMHAESIEAIGISGLNRSLDQCTPEQIIERHQFHRFVLTSHRLRPEVDEDATIEIISPVLRDGRYKWKGIYQGKPIGFSMADSSFRGQVVREEVSFQHGSFLNCVLHINRELDEVGEVVITGYTVAIVIKKYDDRQAIETVQGKEYRQAQAFRDGQDDLFENE